jgi:hypothetical protein
MALVIDTDQGQTDMNIHMKKKCLFRYLATSLFPMKIDLRNNKNAFFSNQHLAIIDRVQFKLYQIKNINNTFLETK